MDTNFFPVRNVALAVATTLLAANAMLSRRDASVDSSINCDCVLREIEATMVAIADNDY